MSEDLTREAAAPVTSKMLLALQDRFRRAGEADAGGCRPAATPESHLVALTVARLELQHISNHRLVVVDGATDQLAGVGAAAAADGQALIGWFRHEPKLKSEFAEFQAVRLGFRLAGQWQRAKIFSDSQVVCSELQRHTISGQRVAELIGCNETGGITEVAAHLGNQEVSVRWVGDPGRSRHRAGSGPLAVRAHRLAWAAHRLVCDDIHPAAELEFLARFAQSSGARRSVIVTGYRRWLAARAASGPAGA